ncbi:nicotinamide riboside kinase 1-like isoform X4 [Tachypleus tridentatus]|uniref:nicotinamide riboside kinase 1-like isoform X4 n=1 Tax=Tachypleus tridentatus TaxID=6853 RepID=UPI003FD58790
MKGWILVGLSGVTCGGKTTLAAMLQKSVTGSIILSQDEFFREEYSDKHEMIPELQHVNWESLSSIDWNSLMSKLFELMRHEPPTGNPLLIVEGHLIFNYLVRIYSPPDPPGYFDKCVWPMYMKNKKEIEENVMDVVIFDGAEETISILEKILNDIGAKQDT